MDKPVRTTTPGCRCTHCYGLAEYMLDQTGKNYGLPSAEGCGSPADHRTEQAAAQTVTIKINTVGCDGTMICPCAACTRERAERVRNPRKPAAQPWEAKQAA